MVAGPPVNNSVEATVVVGSLVQAGTVSVTTPAGRSIAVAGLPAPSVFVGRSSELSRLVSALSPHSVDAVLVWSLGGLPGVGKTALAVCAAHKAVAAGWFPGGVVLVNLRGYDFPDQRVSASAALVSLLGALGAAGEDIPPNLDDRARLWRSMLAGRDRMLVIADNVSQAAQVEPLLPGIGDHKVLITSRHRLAGLDNTRLLDLDVLDPADAVRMLSTVIAIGDPSDTRAADDPASVERVVELCGHLPLAVRVAAANLVANPERPMAEMAEALTDERHRLTELDYDGSLAVRAAFDLSYAQLEEAEARLLRLTALDPGPDVSIEAMAAIADIDLADARQVAQRLRIAHLLQPSPLRGRWRMHDLVRLYAAERASHELDHDLAVQRLLDYYVNTLKAAHDYFVNWEKRSNPRFAHRRDAVRWVIAELGNLIAAMNLAHASGRPDYVVQFALHLFEYFTFSKRWNEWISTHQLALKAARRQAYRRMEAILLLHLGVAYRELMRTGLAMDCFRQSMRIFRRVGDRLGFGRSLHQLGKTYSVIDRLAAAMICCRWALDICRASENWWFELSVSHDIAVVYHKRGEFRQAIGQHQRDLIVLRANGIRLQEGRALDTIGLAYREMGLIDEAIDCHCRNLEICRELVDPYGEARTMKRLALAYRDNGQLADAIKCHTAALHTYQSTGPRHMVGTTLRELGVTYAKQGRNEEARQCLSEALDILSGFPAAQFGDVVRQARVELAALPADQA